MVELHESAEEIETNVDSLTTTMAERGKELDTAESELRELLLKAVGGGANASTCARPTAELGCSGRHRGGLGAPTWRASPVHEPAGGAVWPITLHGRAASTPRSCHRGSAATDGRTIGQGDYIVINIIHFAIITCCAITAVGNICYITVYSRVRRGAPPTPTTGSSAAEADGGHCGI